MKFIPTVKCFNMNTASNCDDILRNRFSKELLYKINQQLLLCNQSIRPIINWLHSAESTLLNFFLSRSMLGFWSGNKLIIQDIFLLLCLMWSIHDKKSASPGTNDVTKSASYKWRHTTFGMSNLFLAELPHPVSACVFQAAKRDWLTKKQDMLFKNRTE